MFRSAADWTAHFATLLNKETTSMSFTPRLRANGRVCCSNPNNLCPKCAAHALNPYAPGLANRSLAASDLQPAMDPKYQPRGVAPDGYRIALATRKVNQ